MANDEMGIEGNEMGNKADRSGTGIPAFEGLNLFCANQHFLFRLKFKLQFDP